jgi:hypothetical protein
MTSISDPVFGKLEHKKETWEGNIRLENLERSFELVIACADQGSPTDKERQAFSQFVRPQMTLAIEKALFRFCSDNFEMYSSGMDKQEVALNDSKEVWQLINITQVYVDGFNYETAAVSLVCDFKWDEENGLEIAYLNDLIGIGDAGGHWQQKRHYDLRGNPIPK